MTKNFRRYSFVLPLVAAAGLCTAEVPGTGRAQIKSIRTYSGASSLAKPESIVVYDFATTADEVKLNSAMLSRIRTRVSESGENDRKTIAKKIAADFSESLIKDFEKTGIPVTRGIPGEPPPNNSVAVQGHFLTIDEGNRTRRMVVGLGIGASKVVAHVECYLGQRDKVVMLTEFTAQSESARRPGAAETMGAGAAPELVAATSGISELKQGAESDTGRLAKATAKQIEKTFSTQGWIEKK